MTQFEKNATTVVEVWSGYYDPDEGYYLCPECGEPIYEEDWDSFELKDYICPVCEWDGEEY